ncbi:MAG TPA: diacylglycerol kinase family protein [Sandaracinaceae bacterium]
MTDTVVIANPRAGSAVQGERLAELAADLGWTWRWTQSGAEATRVAREACEHGVARIVAAGGDGTVHCVVQGILATRERPVLAVLPIGTGNDLVRTLGFPPDPEQVLAELAEGAEVRAIDVARARIGRFERYLVNGSAAGFSGEVDRAVDEDEKARWGPLAYVRAAFDVIGDLPCYRIRVAVDGAELAPLECVGLTVTNGRTCGGGMQVAPGADLEDGKLDLLVVRRASKLALAGVAAQLRTGRVLENRNVRSAAGARIELRSDPPMPINVDGELIGDVHTARWEVLPRELPVAVGPAYDADRDRARALAEQADGAARAAS